MKRTAARPDAYRPPTIETIRAAAVVEALGPVSAGSAQPCGPMLPNFCL